MGKNSNKLGKPKGFFLTSNSVFTDHKFIKKNISLILIIPSILGGLLQLYHLSNISPEYIRFFSISQVVPDGLLFLVILISFILSFEIITYFAYLLLKNIDKSEDRNSETVDKPKGYWTSILFVIFSIVAIIFIIQSGLFSLNFQYQNGGISFFFDVLIKIFFLNLLFIWGFLSISIFYDFIKNYIYDGKRGRLHKFLSQKKPQNLFIKIATIGYIVIIVTMANNAHRFKLKNIDYLTNHIIKKNNLLSEPVLLYYNDKYLFYEFNIENEREVLIYEFTDLFNIVEDAKHDSDLRLLKIKDSVANLKQIQFNKSIDSINTLTKHYIDSIEKKLELRNRTR